MNHSKLSVRELQSKDIDLIINYWLTASSEYLNSMGVDEAKMPSITQWQQQIGEQLNQDYQDKKSYCMIWIFDGKAIGHCNVNKIKFGIEAHMHLHIWEPINRNKGYGIKFIKITLPYFFTNLKLLKLICEPYALNPSPNKTLKKLGFHFDKNYSTVPGWLNFEQEVTRWELSKNDFDKLKTI